MTDEEPTATELNIQAERLYYAMTGQRRITQTGISPHILQSYSHDLFNVADAFIRSTNIGRTTPVRFDHEERTKDNPLEPYFLSLQRRSR